MKDLEIRTENAVSLLPIINCQFTSVNLYVYIKQVLALMFVFNINTKPCNRPKHDNIVIIIIKMLNR